MNDYEISISSDQNSIGDVKISIQDIDITASLESIEIDLSNDQYVVRGSTSIANQLSEDNDQIPLTTSFKVYPRGFKKYYTKIKSYVILLPQGERLFSVDIAEKLRINVQIVEGILNYLVKQGELKINA